MAMLLVSVAGSEQLQSSELPQPNCNYGSKAQAGPPWAGTLRRALPQRQDTGDVSQGWLPFWTEAALERGQEKRADRWPVKRGYPADEQRWEL